MPRIEHKNKKYIVWCIFLAYIICLFIFVVFKFDGSFERIIDLRRSIEEAESLGTKNINLVPFRSISPFLQNIFSVYAFVNIFGNILVFVPFGFLLRILTKKNIVVIFISLLTIVSIEMIQFYLKIGFFDIDDIILNSLGTLLGCFSCIILEKKLKQILV